MTSRLPHTAVSLVSVLTIVGGALPSAALEILTTLDNFEEGPFQLEAPTRFVQSGLSTDNVLGGQRLIDGFGTRSSAELTLSPDDDGVVVESDSEGNWVFQVWPVLASPGGFDLTVGGADRFVVTISEGSAFSDAQLEVGAISSPDGQDVVTANVEGPGGAYSFLFSDYPDVDLTEVLFLTLRFVSRDTYKISDWSTARPSVPEPSTAMLLLFGLGARLIRRRRRA